MSLHQKGSRYVDDVLSYTRELFLESDISNLNLKDILGFEPPKGANVFVPYIQCIPITALLPLYDTLIVGIPKIKKISNVKNETGFTFDDIVNLAHNKRLILYVNVDCVTCLSEMSSVIQQFVDNDVPLFFQAYQELLLALKAADTVGINCDEGWKIMEQYSLLIEDKKTKDDRKKLYALARRLHKMPGKPPFTALRYTYPITICSMIKPTVDYVRQVIHIGKKGASKEHLRALIQRLYMIPKFLMAKAFNSNLSTNIACRHLHGIEEVFKESLPSLKTPNYFDPSKLEFIEKKLHIAYSENISLAEYSEIFDSKTTEIMRKIVKKIMSDPLKKGKSFIALQNSLNDYNREVSELISRRTKRTKIVYASSDILRSNAEAIKMLIGGVAEKYLNAPQKAWDCVIIPQRYRHSISKWLTEKAVNLESKLVGVSPDIIHLYHVRTCLDKIKRKSYT